MAQKQTSSLNHKFTITVVDSVEAYDIAAKRAGACLSDAINQVIAHDTLGDIRDVFVGLIEEKTGIKRVEVNTGKITKNEKGESIPIMRLETEGDYYQRVCAELGLDEDKEPFADLAARISAGGDKEVKFDPSVREKKAPKSPKLRNDSLEYAKSYLSRGTAGKFADAAAKRFGIEVKLTGDPTADLEPLAWGVQKYADAIDDEAKAQRKAQMADIG